MLRAFCFLIFASALACGQAPVFFPLPSSAGNTTASEFTAPYRVPTGVRQSLVSRRFDIQGLPGTFSDWDMMDVSADGRFLFVPSEASRGAGVFRIDRTTGTAVSLLRGNNSGSRNSNPATFNASSDDFARLDPCTLTPFGTLITGEETTGGRLIEVLNPLAASGFQVRWLSKVPAIAHEGLRFDAAGTLYFVDEDNSGSIYKYVPTVPGDLAVGQTFVLTVDGYGGAAGSSWNAAGNIGAIRTGAATWVPMTDLQGQRLTTANPFAFAGTTGGRTAADELDGTPYGRPEDIVIGRLANGNEVLWFTATSENTVYSVELITATTAFVRIGASNATIHRATGQPLSAAASPRINSPDNLEIDAFGDIYVIEDSNPGDIWKLEDANGDGVAESAALFISLGVSGSEPTGMRVDPTDPWRFYVITQHPSSNNDAIFAIDTRPFPGSDDGARLAAGVDRLPTRKPGEFVQRATALSSVNLLLDSPNGALDGAPYLVALQPRQASTILGMQVPFVHIDLNQPWFYLVDPTLLPPPQLPVGGAAVSIIVPTGLSGAIVRVQAGVLSSSARNGAIALSDAYDFYLQ